MPMARVGISIDAGARLTSDFVQESTWIVTYMDVRERSIGRHKAASCKFRAWYA